MVCPIKMGGITEAPRRESIQRMTAAPVSLSTVSEWSCSNLLSSLSVSFPEDQIPHGFPTIDMGPQLKVVERTRTATMLCAASGNPDPEISWFKDFLPVDINSSNGRIKQLRSGNESSHARTHQHPRNPISICLCIHFWIFRINWPKICCGI